MYKGDRHEKQKGHPSKRRGIPGGMSFSMKSIERKKGGKTTMENTEGQENELELLVSKQAVAQFYFV
jgi:hypothetical protein